MNDLCPGLKSFFAYSSPYLQKLAAFWQPGEPLDRFMQLLRDEDARASGQARRNDPCPCGSGRKYKKCCFGKPLKA